MQLTLVHVHVKVDRVDAFIAATGANREGTIREVGALRFDVLQSEDDPSRFILFELFRDPESAGLHKTTAHYLAWRDTVAPWMETPREGRRYRLLNQPETR